MKEKVTLKTMLLFILVMIIAVFGTVIVYDSTRLLSYKQLYMQVKIVDVGGMGMNVDDDALYFGSVPKGSGSARYLVIENNYNRRIRINFAWKGDIADFVQVSDNDFFLEPNESLNVSIGLNIPNNVELGNYTGEMLISYYRR